MTSRGTDAAAPAPTVTPRRLLGLLALSAAVAVPVAATSYAFLAATRALENWFYHGLPTGLGLDPVPGWWPVPVLALAGLLVALAIDKLPGHGGHSPADGFAAGEPVLPAHLPGVVLAALASLALGVVLGPEAPLIALGSGLGVLGVRLVRRDAPAQVTTVVAAASTFAVISTLLGSPLVTAILLAEATGVGLAALGLVVLPGLLAAGVGSLVFVALDALTGLGTFSLHLPALPEFTGSSVPLFLWALAVGLAAAVLGGLVRAVAQGVRAVGDRRRLLVAPLVGVAIALTAVAFDAVTGKGADQVLFSGEVQLAPLVEDAGSWAAPALALLVVVKAAAYGLSLSSFRGGPVFPALFIGAAAGLAIADLPGLSTTPAVAMAAGAMCVAMLRLPVTSVILAAAMLTTSSALHVLPLVIVAVVVSHVVTDRLPAFMRLPAGHVGEPSPGAGNAPA